jgi:hypothetical protein
MLDAEAAKDRDDPGELSVVVLGVALGEPDPELAQSFCSSPWRSGALTAATDTDSRSDGVTAHRFTDSRA